MNYGLLVIAKLHRRSQAGLMAKHTRTPSLALRFLAQPGPRAEAAVLLLAAGGRAFAAARGERPSWADAAVGATLIVTLPFVEWLVHSRLLHAKPLQWRGRSFLPAATRAHAAHHADPRDERLIVTPLRALLPLLPVMAAAAAVPSWSLRATAVAVLMLLVLSSEWVHFLVHAQASPKSARLRRRSRAHRLHHYRNDRYWFGLTSGLADAVMGTAPRRDATPVRDSEKADNPPVGPGAGRGGATMRRPGLTAASRESSRCATSRQRATEESTLPRRRTSAAPRGATSALCGAPTGHEEASRRVRRAVATGRAAAPVLRPAGETFRGVVRAPTSEASS